VQIQIVLTRKEENVVNAQPEINISEILNGFYRRKWMILCVFIVTACLSIYLAAILPEVYRSSTLILVSPQKLPTSFVTSTVTTNLNERMQSIIQEILSRTNLEKIVQEFGLYPGVRLMEDRVASLRAAVNVNLRRSNTFQLSYDSQSPETAKQIAARLGSLFIDQNLQVREQQAMGTKNFINTEAERLRKELEEQEAEVNRFRAAHRFELPDQLDANLRTVEQLRRELQGSLSRLASLRERKGALEKQLVEVEIAGPELAGAKGSEGQALSDVTGQLRKRELDTLLRRYSVKHPEVIRLKNEIAAVEAQTKDSKDSVGTFSAPITSPLAQVLRKQIAGLDSEAVSVQSQVENLQIAVGNYQSRIDNTPVRGIDLSRISRTHDITLKKYQDLLGKGLESELAENMEKKQKGEQFQLLDPANFPLKAFRPNRQRIILVGLLAGLAAGFGLAFLWETLDRSFKHSEELNGYVDLPVLATLPAVLTRGSVLDERRAHGLLVLASIGILVVGLLCVRQFGPIYF
jgi:polysaccharide chain length determinant protein (PEP-CTERM system associated)